MAKNSEEEKPKGKAQSAFRRAVQFAGKCAQPLALGASLLIGADYLSSWLFSTTSLVTPLISSSGGAVAALGASIGLLVLNAETTVTNALALGNKLKMSVMALGAMIGSLNTVPEIMVSLGSVYRGAVELGIGNIIGSNIAHSLLVLGATAAVAGIGKANNMSWKFNSLVMTGTAALFGSQLIMGTLYPAVGAAMILGGGFYIKKHLSGKDGQHIENHDHDHKHQHGHDHNVHSHEDDHGHMHHDHDHDGHDHDHDEVGACLFHDHDNSEQEERAKARPKWANALLAAAGMSGLIAASSLVVDSGINFADTFNLASLGFDMNFGFSQALVGAMFVAIGTSLPELFVNINAIRRGNSDLAIGNVLGCSITNTLIAGGALSLTGLFTGGGFSGIAVPDAFNMSTTSGIFNVSAFIGSAGLLTGTLMATKGALSRAKGAIALMAYTAYLGASIYLNDGKAPTLHQHNLDEGHESEHKTTITLAEKPKALPLPPNVRLPQ